MTTIRVDEQINTDWIKRASVQKYNPNHGADGRFTSGSGGGGFTSNTADHASMNAKRAASLDAETKHIAGTIKAATGLTQPAEVRWLDYKQVADEAGGNSATIGFYDATKPGVINVSADDPDRAFFATHEYAHLVDRELLGEGTGRFASAKGPNSPVVGGVIKSIQATPQYKAWLYEPDGGYWASNPELFARAFAQYVTVKSGDGALSEALGIQEDRQWSEDDFGPIYDEFDKLFETKA